MQLAMKLYRQALCVILVVVGGSAGLRAQEVKFWTGDPVGAYLDVLGGKDGAKLEPVRIVGARNGAFSGKVVVSSDQPIEQISAKIGDLATADGKATIAAARVQVRPAKGWIKSGWMRQEKAASTFDVLHDSFAFEQKIDLLTLKPGQKYYAWVPPGLAFVPVWVTVNVPADAPEGDYSAALTVSVGSTTKTVPVNVKVCGYTLPDAKAFRTWVETIQSPDTLAVEYNVPLWSDAHWKLIEQSLRYGSMLGNKTVYIPLICQTNLGNAESYVRWIRDGEAKFTYDLSIAEKYLDLQIKVQGKPTIVCFVLWDNFLEGGEFNAIHEPEAIRAERQAYKGNGPDVTLLDKSTGKTEPFRLPEYSDPASSALWAPLLAGLPKLLDARGIDASALCVGTITDQTPTAAALEFVKKQLPTAHWVIQAHSFYGGKEKRADYRYAAFVWGVKGFCTGNKGWEGQGVKDDMILTHFMRNMDDSYPLSAYRIAAEVNITGGQRGLGRIGLDYWKALKNKRQVRDGQVWMRYPKANWRNLNITDSLLMPGPAGPLATARFEMLREGVQECEARIFVQTALDGGKLPAALADRCRLVLAQRDELLKKTAMGPQDKGYFNYGYLGEQQLMDYVADRQGQSEALYRAAADVAGMMRN